MTNPFSNTYKIVEHSNLDGAKEYFVEYGNLLFHNWLLKSGELCEFYHTAKHCGGNFKSLDAVKQAIRIHQEEVLNKRLSKITTKTIARI
jgi:hypothetical protein